LTLALMTAWNRIAQQVIVATRLDHDAILLAVAASGHGANAPIFGHA
jgi:hypothetical protein